MDPLAHDTHYYYSPLLLILIPLASQSGTDPANKGVFTA